jgi:hypothetical protein
MNLELQMFQQFHWKSFVTRQEESEVYENGQQKDKNASSEMFTFAFRCGAR